MRGRRPARTAGDRPVMMHLTTRAKRTETTAMTASETVVLKERKVPGGEREMKIEEAAGETLAEMTLAEVIVMNAVIESAGMTANKEAHPEIRMEEALGVVEATIRGRRGTGTVPEMNKSKVTLTETGVGALTKTTLVVPRMRRMMTAGPLFAAEQLFLHLFGSNDKLVSENKFNYPVIAPVVIEQLQASDIQVCYSFG